MKLENEITESDIVPVVNSVIARFVPDGYLRAYLRAHQVYF